MMTNGQTASPCPHHPARTAATRGLLALQPPAALEQHLTPPTQINLITRSQYPVLLSPVWSQPRLSADFDIASLDNAIATLE